MKQMFPALKILLIMTVITGIIYPLLVTGISQLFFPFQATGSILTVQGQPVGSALIGQKFSDPRYFQPRPSAVDYNPMPSGGSNLGPISAVLKDLIAARRADLVRSCGGLVTDIPKDLLFASGSGLDPHISPEAALYQIGRISNARHLSDSDRLTLRNLVIGRVEKRSFNILGEPRINVLLLNLAVDSTFGESKP
ncbi:MAG: potassium-transporting ATPase subunit KdpC [bacterium]|nr:potassium-transporting ATPase subunit KdpC [bacterium]